MVLCKITISTCKVSKKITKAKQMKGLINNEQEKMKVLMNFKGQTFKGIIAPTLWISLFGLLGRHATLSQKTVTKEAIK